MKGIILAGGTGSRLFPLTTAVSKQLLPVYDKPMIYYPLATLMLSDITEILIITKSEDKSRFESLLGDGSKFGICIKYETQDNPSGLPEAFVIGEEFIGNDRVCLILGDNIFHADTFINTHIIPNKDSNQATIFGYYVNDPERYGIVEVDDDNLVKSIEEKPISPKSNYAITGLYMFNNDVISIAKNLQPSSRGETEIVDIIKHYHSIDNLNVELLGRGVAWLDTGTHSSLQDASNYIEVLENRQGLKIACIEEIAYNKGYIDKDQLLNSAKKIENTGYGRYLSKIASSTN
jgi:glucose-1-phosphate thymidylyltransferase